MLHTWFKQSVRGWVDHKEGAVPPGDSIIHNVTSLFSQGERVNNKYFKHCVANQFFNQNGYTVYLL